MLRIDGHAKCRDVRKWVADTIARREHPSRSDLDLALSDIPGEPVPRAIIDYVRAFYVRLDSLPRTTGPKSDRKTNIRDQLISLYYRMVLAGLQASEYTNEVKTLAIADTAALHRLSPRQVRRILKAQRAI